MNETLKVALVHDWLVSKGGAENVLFDLHCLFPNAPIYTLVYDKASAPEWTLSCDIRTTYIQKIPYGKKLYKKMLSLMPKAWESLDLTEYDLIISSSSSCAKGVITSPNSVHICYCHTPTRYIWDMYYSYLEASSFVKKCAMKMLVPKLRLWDYVAAQRVDYFIANSRYIANRIKKFYRRDSKVIYPGCYINDYDLTPNTGDYYLIVSRLVYYKRIDLAVKACNKLKKKLIIVGAGEEYKKLKAIAGPTIEFKGFMSDDEIRKLYLNAKAFIFPGEEDFGITPIEAQSAGIPVLAFGRGGALETVKDMETGLFFDEQSEESLSDCILRFEADGVSYNKEQIRENSLNFSRNVFSTKILEFINSVLGSKK